MRQRTPIPHDASPPRRWLRAAAAALLMLAVGTTSFAAPTTLPDPPGLVGGYSKSLLTPESQGYGLPTFVWQNVVPNALADYFTYQPMTTANAVLAGFPSSCGRLATDVLSTEDCYIITAQRFPQGLSVLGGPGLLDAAGVAFGLANPNLLHRPLTDVYGYGSGPNNAPAVGPFAASGAHHWPAMTLKGTKGRPVRVAWINELPNQIIPGFDATVDCGEALYCFPYNRLVTHVHGAHVGPESDGWTRGWYTPGFNLTGTVAQPTSVVFNGPFNSGTPVPQTYPGWISTSSAVATNTYQYGPEGTYYYPMDQEAGTIWYHDHAIGLTHINTNMGLAGFFPTTDDNEKCKQGITNALLCPTTTKILPTSPFEYGYALQDRIFDVNGQLAMPARLSALWMSVPAAR